MLVVGTQLFLKLSMQTIFLSGIILASEHKAYKSAPEYPLVISPSRCTSSPDMLKVQLLVREVMSCFLPSKFGSGMYSLFVNLLRTASSSYRGRFVAPMINTRSYKLLLVPSNQMRNSVFTLLDDYCSPSLLEQSRESISSMKITLGCLARATVNRVLTSFSLSPTHLLVRELALIEKKVAEASLATAFPINVFPVPGGPNNKIPFGGARTPVKMSGRRRGQIIISFIILFAKESPAMSHHFTPEHFFSISLYIVATNLSYIGGYPFGGYYTFLQGGTNFRVFFGYFNSRLGEMNQPGLIESIAFYLSNYYWNSRF